MMTSAYSIIPTNSNLATVLPKWQAATWADYLDYCDRSTPERARIFFNQGYLFIEMGTEGINHAWFSDLFTALFFIWFNRNPTQTYDSFGRCLLEKPEQRAASPDLVLYIGADSPRWQAGEPRRINLNQWRVPDLVGEVGDTTIATDLDEKKLLYAALGIPEYWVVDVEALRVIAFRLQPDGKYEQCADSTALNGLAIATLDQTLIQLSQGSSSSALSWFAQKIQ
jgi:Uma2 family endonuclease